jgi:hypothetical protein
MTAREEFLAGDRLDDVLVYLSAAAVSDPEALADHGETVDDGVVLVMPGDRARSAFQAATGIDPMGFARRASDTEGAVDADLTGGECPAATDDPAAEHDVRFVFAFAEAQNEEAGGLYAEGDVIHAYVSCACGQTYSEKWVAGDR